MPIEQLACTSALCTLAVRCQPMILFAACSLSKLAQKHCNMDADQTEAALKLLTVCGCCVRHGMRARSCTLACCDLTKFTVFDAVYRKKAWQVSLSRVATPQLVVFIRDLHNHSAVVYRKVNSASVGINVGCRPGYVLPAPLFNICLDARSHQLPERWQLGVTVFYKIDGQHMHCRNPTRRKLLSKVC